MGDQRRLVGALDLDRHIVDRLDLGRRAAVDRLEPEAAADARAHPHRRDEADLVEPVVDAQREAFDPRQRVIGDRRQHRQRQKSMRDRGRRTASLSRRSDRHG